ncbi:unnamed protein product [Phytomonas sp. Hart1]|nr:unnamed protein product [Phytomonas sp. Hart1]|eukprot:CCW69755.1 unnamed protein product [Phytomonas sp. isolate Hart1]
MSLVVIVLLGLFVLVGCLLGLHARRGRGKGQPWGARPPAPSSTGGTRDARNHRDATESEEEENGAERGPRTRPRRTAGEGEPAGMRRRRPAHRRRQDGANEEAEGGARSQGPLSRLQRMKQERERERAERRQADEAEQEARRREKEETDRRATQHAESEEEWAVRENAALQELRDAKRKHDDEEYAKWVGHIEVEECGELEQETQKRREAIISFLKQRANEVNAGISDHSKYPTATSSLKNNGCDSEANCEDSDSRPSNILVLQDTARTLEVSVEELVAVIEELVREDTLFGVFDDRGKFVVMSELHFPMIAKFIIQRGRVSLTELARECNRIILQK